MAAKTPSSSKKKNGRAPTLLSTESAPDDLSLLDQDAQALVEAAALLTEAETGETLGEALAHNLRVWIAIRTLVGAEDNPLPDDVRANLSQLAAYVIKTTLGGDGVAISQVSIESLARINLHIAEGLMRSQQNRLIRDRAFQLWEEQGRPDGLEMENWLHAERDILALMATD